MVEDVSKSKQRSISRELPTNVAEYSTTFGKPRFVGVPQDNQLIENSSLEGILHGRKISEVYKQDTQELQAADIEWDRAVFTLKCLSVACAHHEDVVNRAYKELKEDVLKGKNSWEATEHEKKSYNRKIKSTQQQFSKLVDFGGKISAYDTGARFQFDDPIKDSGPRGDGTPFDLIADKAREREIIFDNGDTTFTTTVNPQTLYQAEAYHLLEKGNRYEMTGENLALIVNSFNEKIFYRQLKPWLKEKEKEMTASLKILTGHREKIKFSDGKEVEHSVGNDGFLDFILSEKPFCRMYINQKDGEITGISLSGEDWRNTVSIEADNNTYYQVLDPGYFGEEPVKEIIKQGERLFNIVQTARQLHDTAENSPDRILLSNSQIVYQLINKVMKIVNPAS